MTTTCPNCGAESEWPDWCSACGARLGDATPDAAAVASAASAASASPGSAASTPPVGTAAGATTCSNCGANAHPDDAFCENCGYDFASGTLPVVVEAAPAPASPQAGDAGAAPAVTTPLVVSVAIDADFFAATTADVELALPDPLPDASEITLTASRNLVGRHSESRGILPEVDIEALTDDPGVSSKHLMFERTASGIWTFTDLGSTNGTYLSAEATADPVAPGNALPVADGMTLWLGAWTRLDLAIPPEDDDGGDGNEAATTASGSSGPQA